MLLRVFGDVGRGGGDGEGALRFHRAAPGQDGDADDDHQDHETRRNSKEDAVDVLGTVIFLDDEFQSVGERLAESPEMEILKHGDDAEAESDAIGADAVLDPTGDFALKQNQIGDRSQNGEMRHQENDEPGRDIG